MSNPLKIKLLKRLPMATAANRELLKLIETLCVIKALWVDCPMPDTPAARLEVAEASGRSVKTINRRITALLDQEWLRGQALRGFDTIGWPALATKYGIRHTNFYWITLVPGVFLEDIIYSKSEDEKLKQCEHAYKMRVRQNNLIKETLDEVAGTAYHVEAVANHQFLCFNNEGAGYTDEERYVLSTHFIHKDQKVLRADTALNYKSWSKFHGYKSRGGYAYLKRKLELLGLITIRKRISDLPGHSTRASRQQTRQGFVRFNTNLHQLQLIQPDLITVLPLKGLQERMERNKARGPMKAPVDPKRSKWVLKSWKTKRKKAHEKIAA